jgi:hypothetical protein
MNGGNRGALAEPRRLALVRLAALALLLVITVVAVRARAGLRVAPGPLSSHGQVLGGALGLVLAAVGVCAAVLLAWMIGLPRRRRRGDEQTSVELTDPRWARLLALLASLSAIVLPWVLLAWVAVRHHSAATGGHAAPSGVPSATGPAVPSPSPISPSRSNAASGDPALWVVSGGAAALVLLIVISTWIWSSRRSTPTGFTPVSDRPAERESGVGPWADAARAGREALPEGDARAGIIGCYAAMERHLTAEGVPRAPADTPSELLGRAARERQVAEVPARTLLGLFQRARFSDHPLGEPERRDAEQALEQIIGAAGGPR